MLCDSSLRENRIERQLFLDASFSMRLSSCLNSLAIIAQLGDTSRFRYWPFAFTENCSPKQMGSLREELDDGTD